MNPPEINNSKTIVFKPKGGQTEFQVILDGEQDTVWVTEQQIMELFGKARRTIGEHIKNIYEEGELEKAATWREFRQVQKEGKREVTRKTPIYNLDIIISVGYRVKSQVGIEFRKWATQKLKEYLIKGYSINQEMLCQEKRKIELLNNELNNLNEELLNTQKSVTDGLISIISHYTKSFALLNKFDQNELSSENLNTDLIYTISYKDVNNAIQQLKSDLIGKGEASELFGIEKDNSFQGILGSISQTVFKDLAYPTIEEQAAQLLYSIIKGHPFIDGNKRIGSFVFVWFLQQNNYHLTQNGERKISENTLVTLALAVAQSLPEQRKLIQKLLINLIKN